MRPVSASLSAALLLGLLSASLQTGCDQGSNSPPRVESDDSLYVNSIGMTFEYVPPGRFQMGSEHGEIDEQPVHGVHITEGFYIGTYEVTQAQWNQLMADNPSYFEGVNLPVENVNWYQVQAFIDSLNEREETTLYRLPTEAEWEYATRGETDTRFYFGSTSDSLRHHAWYGFNSDRRAHAIGTKRSNPYGLHDVYGNVWEWIADAYDPSFYESSAVRNPLNTGSARSRRVIRGGGWYGVVSDLRSANRGWARPGAADPQLGFRLVRELPQSEQQ